MDRNLNPSEVHRLAATELNLFHLAGTIPGLHLEGAHIQPGTPIYDLTGEILFYRVGLTSSSGPSSGYADIAAHSLFGAPLLATAPDTSWNARAWLEKARAAYQLIQTDVKRQRDYDEIRFVAYSFPKLAVQFLADGKEITMLELGTWAVVPPANRDRRPLEPGSFERWSLIEELPKDQQAEAHKRFEERLEALNKIELPSAAHASLISKSILEPAFGVLSLYDSWELHYSTDAATHTPCYQLHGQETNVWCVAASVQMVLEFYRYQYTQSRIAQQLGLGTLSNPSGLPYARDNDVAVALNAMSSGALTANMLTTPAFSAYTSELRANRPMVSFIPGHSRSVAGYTQSRFVLLHSHGFRGLLVYDPWPPNAGVITRWENFDTQTYRRAFTAHVTTI